MRAILKHFALAILTLALCLPPPAVARPNAQDLSAEALSKLSDLQSAAQQLAEQSGQFAGRSIGPQLASGTGQLLQVLTNFDKWACASAVTALHLKRQRLVVAAAGMMPADPKLDKAVDDFGNLISQLQELCNKYVYDAGRPGASGGATAGGAPTPPAHAPLPPPPTMTPQEQICYDRCHDLYVQYGRAELEYERARRDAEAARQRAGVARQKASTAAERARAASQTADDIRRDYDQQQAALSASHEQAERLRIAERLSHLHPDAARKAADDAQRASEQAAQDAQWAEDRAASSEAVASSLYDAMLEIYQAWEHCARNCADQAKAYDRVDLDWHRLFSAMPDGEPRRPPFYRAPPAPAAQPRTVETRTSSRIIAPPAALSSGMLVGAVYDSEGQPQRQQRIAVTEPDGSRHEVTTNSSGRFSIDVPAGSGTLGLSIPGAEARPTQLSVVEQLPSGIANRPPEFLELGKAISVATPYRAVSLVGRKGVAIEVPTATAVGRDGRSGISSFSVPYSLGIGPVKIRAVGLDGRETVIEAISYGYLRAWIGQDKLHSGQNAEFGFDVDFGTGPMPVVAVVTIEGPIVYDKVGQPQLLQVGADGKTRLTGQVHALKGSPTGIPFTITATFTGAK